jgi:hypothetical protein
MGQVRMTIESLRRSLLNNRWLLVLKDDASERYLPISIEESQAKSIENEFIKRKPSKERSPLGEIGFKITGSSPLSLMDFWITCSTAN